jgi:hypothetical protein
VSFVNDASYLAISHPALPYLTIYSRDADVFTNVPNPDEMPSAAPAGVAFTGSGSFMAVIYGAPPFLDFYRVSGNAFVKETELADPPSGAATTFALARDHFYVGLVAAPPPYMSSYVAIPPFDIATEFVLPAPLSITSAISPVRVTNYIKAKP